MKRGVKMFFLLLLKLFLGLLEIVGLLMALELLNRFFGTEYRDFDYLWALLVIAISPILLVIIKVAILFLLPFNKKKKVAKILKFYKEDLNTPFKVYYRLYYLLFARQIIKKPRKVVPINAILCQAELDPGCGRHKNFLYAPVKPMKWFFWGRSFAFKVVGINQWYELPKLTPWSTDEHGITTFGLNFTFVEKHKDQNLEFCTWL